MKMKIFSSFDTNFRNEIVDREKKEFWDDKVLLITHWRFYYYFSVLVPAIGTLLLIILYWLWLFYFKDFFGEIWTAYWIMSLILFFVFSAPIFFTLIKKYIDYILDFVVVTPKKLIYYNQEGIFSRKGRTVDAEKIKTITVNKTGLLRSIFNFWNIIILTEWDEQWQGEINFKFVDNPDEIKFRIWELIDETNKLS